MLTIGQRNELRQAAEIWRTSRAPHSGAVPNKTAISEPADLASGNQGQTNERSVQDTETFNGPALWFVAIAVICGLIAFGATKL